VEFLKLDPLSLSVFRQIPRYPRKNFITGFRKNETKNGKI